jgi:hypothetical protein
VWRCCASMLCRHAGSVSRLLLQDGSSCHTLWHVWKPDGAAAVAVHQLARCPRLPSEWYIGKLTRHIQPLTGLCCKCCATWITYEQGPNNSSAITRRSHPCGCAPYYVSLQCCVRRVATTGTVPQCACSVLSINTTAAVEPVHRPRHNHHHGPQTACTAGLQQLGSGRAGRPSLHIICTLLCFR